MKIVLYENKKTTLVETMELIFQTLLPYEDYGGFIYFGLQTDKIIRLSCKYKSFILRLGGGDELSLFNFPSGRSKPFEEGSTRTTCLILLIY